MDPGPLSSKSIFLNAIEIADADERQAFVAARCGGDDDLRRDVERLLLHHAVRGSFLESPAQAATTEAQSGTETPGAVVGPYKLLEQIGEGGFGVVFMAEQSHPVQRRVALKIIKPGMDSKQVVARFEAERQALALMDHVNIARVIDGGTTDAGRPYFVMELVHGVPITSYCDDNHLTPHERLELFLPVCQAIQHAHQKGVIHRDVKPSNVLVTLYDGRPVPKVIDFGVAKAIEQRLTERTLFTQHGAMVGTLEYMSPEQAEMSALGVDTRSDIYSLGVLLYELLTGTTPLSTKRFKEAAFAEVVRMIKEDEPPRPSTRLSDSGEALASISANRHMEPARLTKLVEGDLDWIVMKALEKDRNRRYETANGFAMDVQRYLADEPVHARPPSMRYRVGKFVRRNKGPVCAAAIVLVTLLGGIVGTTWALLDAEKAWKAEAERAKGEQAAKEQAERDRLKEQQERKYAQAIAAFVIDDFLALTSTEGQSRFGGESAEHLSKDATLRQLLDRAATKLNERNDLDPRTEAELRWMIGVNYRQLGEAGLAVPFLEKCLTLRQALFEPEHEEILNAKNSLAVALVRAGKYGAAVKLHKEVLNSRNAKNGVDHPQTLTSMNNLAIAYELDGQRELALSLFEKTLRLREAKLGADDVDTLTTRSNLADSYVNARMPERALPLLEETLRLMKAKMGADHLQTLRAMNGLAEGYRVAGKIDLASTVQEDALKRAKVKLGTDHPETSAMINNLAMCYQSAGKFDQAAPLYEDALRLNKLKLGADHPETLTCMNNLAAIYQAKGMLERAVPLFEELFKFNKAKLGTEQQETLLSMNNLGKAYLDAGRLELALPLLEDAVRLMKAKSGSEDLDTLVCLNNLALAYLNGGNLDQALPLFEEILKLRKAKLGGEHPQTLTSMGNLALAHFASRDIDRARSLFEDALRVMKVKMGPDHPETLATMNNLATCYRVGKRLDLALPLLEETLKLRTVKFGPDHPLTLSSMNGLALAYQAVGKHDLALPLLENALAVRKVKQGPDHRDTLTSMNYLALGYKAAGKLDRALPLYEETLRLRKAKLGPDDPDTLTSMNNLAITYEAAKKFDLALPLYEETLKTKRAKLGADHPQTLTTMTNLARAYEDLNKLELALPLLKEAVQAVERRRFQNQNAEAYLNNLIRCHEKLKQFDQGEVQRRKLVSLVKKKSGPDSVAAGAELASLGLNLMRQQKWTEAEAALRECLAIFEVKLPEGWSTFDAQSMLGGVLLEQKKHAAAEPLLVKGYQGMKDRTSKAPPKSKTLQERAALERLVRLYEATNNKDAAAKWRKELEPQTEGLKKSEPPLQKSNSSPPTKSKTSSLGPALRDLVVIS